MSSEWLIDGRKAYTQQSTAKHLAKIIVELTKLLEASPRMVAEARIAVLEWVGQLGYRLNEVVKTIATQSEVMALRATMLRMLFGFSFGKSAIVFGHGGPFSFRRLALYEAAS